MIVIPMAGESRRFTEHGYQVPKYMLPLNGRSVFELSVSSFSSVFDTHDFLFVARNVNDTADFLSSKVDALGIKSYSVVLLDEPTKGQAETVLRGIEKSNLKSDGTLTIFNIDTFRLKEFVPFELQFPHAQGALEVFQGEGDNWSFVEPSQTDQNSVLRTTEKERISNLCCTGLYYFDKVSSFIKSCDAEKESPQSHELFVAPLYNWLLKEGSDVKYSLINETDVTFCGVPNEYESLLQSDLS